MAHPHAERLDQRPVQARDRTEGAVVKVRPGTVVRGTGVALACLAADPAARGRALFAAYAMGWPLNRPGLQVLIEVPDTAEPWKRAMPFAASATSWTTVMFVATTAVRQMKLPIPLVAVMLGGTVVVVDSLLADRQERTTDSKAAAADASEGAAEPPAATNDD